MAKIIGKEYTEFLEQLKDRIATSRYKAALAVAYFALPLYWYRDLKTPKRTRLGSKSY